MRSIPSTPPVNSSERKVWEHLSGLPEDSVIVHSGYIPPADRVGIRQVDIFVVSPNGISILEVKGYSKITRIDGVWYGEFDTEVRDPVQQSQSLKSILRTHLETFGKGWEQVPVESFLVLPNARLAGAESLRNIITKTDMPRIVEIISSVGRKGSTPVNEISNALCPDILSLGEIDATNNVNETEGTRKQYRAESKLSSETQLGKSTSKLTVMEAFELLVKQMCHGLNSKEINDLNSMATKLDRIEVITAQCTSIWGNSNIPVIDGKDAPTGTFYTANNELVLTGDHYVRYLTGSLRIDSSFGVNDPYNSDSPDESGKEELEPESKDESYPSTTNDGDNEIYLSDPTGSGEVMSASWVSRGCPEIDVSISGMTPCAINKDSTVGVQRGTWLRERKSITTFNNYIEKPVTEIVNLELLYGNELENDTHKCLVQLELEARETKKKGLFVVRLLIKLLSVSPENHQQQICGVSSSVSLPAGSLSSFQDISSSPLDTFSHLPSRAVGHGAAVTWETGSKDEIEITNWPTNNEKRQSQGDGDPIQAIPSIKELLNVVEQYEKHINSTNWNDLSSELGIKNRSSAIKQLYAARSFVDSMVADDELFNVFQDAALAVCGKQFFDVNKDRWVVIPKENYEWRKFQILFVLISAASAIDHNHPERRRVDVIEYPTGAGKTEAYLFLSAIVILNSRRMSSGEDRGTKVLMRYPLRLLASQQLTRALSMTSHLTIIVRSKQNDLGIGVYGKNRVRTGLWAGSSLTPNSHLYWDEKKTPLPFSACPLCGSDVKSEKINKKHILYCSGDNCYYGRNVVKNNKIAVDIVDEDIYSNCPEFVVSTLDKLATTPWIGVGKLSGVDKPKKFLSQNISLVIQDELHMLDDELGSIEGVYQIFLESLIKYPKIVAASATSKNTEKQILLLYNRHEVLHIPSEETRNRYYYVGKPDNKMERATFTGIMPSSGISKQVAHATLLASQLQATQILLSSFTKAKLSGDLSEEDFVGRLKELDGVWSNLIFFGSRVLLRDVTLTYERIVRKRQNLIRYMHNYQGGLRKTSRAGKLEASSETLESIDGILKKLNIEISKDNILSMKNGGPSDIPVDVCLATSMIEVGVDVNRLNLMTFIGFPKETNSYIQASGRVGRNSRALVYILFRRGVPRDESIYEDFTNYHQRKSEFVEPALLSPYAPGAIARILPAIVICDYQIKFRTSNVDKPKIKIIIDEVINKIILRMGLDTSPVWLEDIKSSLVASLDMFSGSAISLQSDMIPGNGNYGAGLLQVLGRRAEATPPADLGQHRWLSPTSMRSVGGECLTTINGYARDLAVIKQLKNEIGKPITDEEGDLA